MLRLDTGVLVGLLASTEHLTVGTLTVPVGGESVVESHGGEELLYALRGALHVAAGGVEATLAPGDGVPRPRRAFPTLRRARGRGRGGDLRRRAFVRPGETKEQARAPAAAAPPEA